MVAKKIIIGNTDYETVLVSIVTKMGKTKILFLKSIFLFFGPLALRFLWNSLILYRDGQCLVEVNQTEP